MLSLALPVLRVLPQYDKLARRCKRVTLHLNIFSDDDQRHYYTIIQRMADVAVIDMSFFKVDIMEVNIRKAVKADCKAIR